MYFNIKRMQNIKLNNLNEFSKLKQKALKLRKDTFNAFLKKRSHLVVVFQL